MTVWCEHGRRCQAASGRNGSRVWPRPPRVRVVPRRAASRGRHAALDMRTNQRPVLPPDASSPSQGEGPVPVQGPATEGQHCLGLAPRRKCLQQQQQCKHSLWDRVSLAPLTGRTRQVEVTFCIYLSDYLRLPACLPTCKPSYLSILSIYFYLFLYL